jgi:hypothetical protein
MCVCERERAYEVLGAVDAFTVGRLASFSGLISAWQELWYGALRSVCQISKMFFWLSLHTSFSPATLIQ